MEYSIDRSTLEYCCKKMERAIREYYLLGIGHSESFASHNEMRFHLREPYTALGIRKKMEFEKEFLSEFSFCPYCGEMITY